MILFTAFISASVHHGSWFSLAFHEGAFVTLFGTPVPNCESYALNRLYLKRLVEGWSQPISRVLSWATIPLDQQSLTDSSNLPDPHAGHTLRDPIWSCSGWSLPRHTLLPEVRCALTAPFQPYRHANMLRRSSLCCTCRRLAPPRRYLAPCPLEPGLSSPFLRKRRLPGQLRGAFYMKYLLIATIKKHCVVSML